MQNELKLWIATKNKENFLSLGTCTYHKRKLHLSNWRSARDSKRRSGSSSTFIRVFTFIRFCCLWRYRWILSFSSTRLELYVSGVSLGSSASNHKRTDMYLTLALIAEEGCPFTGRTAQNSAVNVDELRHPLLARWVKASNLPVAGQ